MSLGNAWVQDLRNLVTATGGYEFHSPMWGVDNGLGLYVTNGVNIAGSWAIAFYAASCYNHGVPNGLKVHATGTA